MKCTRAELYATLWKAGRGARLPLGVAEEVAEAAPWFTVADVEELAGCLADRKGRAALIEMVSAIDSVALGQTSDPPDLSLSLIQAVAAGRGLGVAMDDRLVPADRPMRRADPGPLTLPASVWKDLDHLASHTYVPATAASRDGAGAGADEI